MEWEQSVFPLLFIVTGTCNVLLAKWSDISTGVGRDNETRTFQHPVVQTALMFLGQFLCFIIYSVVYFVLRRRGNGAENENLITRGGREFTPITFLLPAALDAVASVLLFSGLYLTYASSFQMIRGAGIIFVGIFGSIYLNQTLIVRHWMAMLTILCALVVLIAVDVRRVVYDEASLPNTHANAILTGDLLILCAQVFYAAQLVYQEKYLKGLDVPAMQAAGWQGAFGLGISVLLGICLNYLPTQAPFNESSGGVFDDMGDAFRQLYSNTWLLVASGLFVVSCACYNFVALSIVKRSSTSNLILADGLRALCIWLAALLLEWEYLNMLTALGFIVLQMGVIAYRKAIFLEWYRSLLARLTRQRYADLSADQGSETTAAQASSRPADVI